MLNPSSHAIFARRADSSRRSAWSREIQLNPWVAVGGITLLAAVLRFTLLGQNSIWFDEAYVIRVTRESWLGVPRLLRLTDAHPPLYYWLMWAWVRVAGTGETAIRFPSAVFSTASVLLTYALVRRLVSGRAGLLAALLTAVAPLQVIAGQEARMYPMLECLVLGSTLALVACVEHGGIRRWTLYVLAAAMMAYTHYLGLVVLLAQGVWIVSFERRHLAPWAAAMVVAAAAYAPWIPSLWFQIAQGHGAAWYRATVDAKMLVDLGALYSFGGSLFGAADYYDGGTLSASREGALVAPFLLVAAWGALALRRHRRGLGLLGATLVVPVVLMFVASQARPLFYPRWFSFLLPFYAVFVASGAIAIGEHVQKYRLAVTACVIGAAVFCSVPVFATYYLDSQQRPYNWRAAARTVHAFARPGDLILYTNGGSSLTFPYYFRDHYPSLRLDPMEALPPRATAKRHFTPQWAARLAHRYSRIWMVTTEPFTPDMAKRLQADLEANYRPVGHRDFGYIWVTLLERTSMQTHE